MTIVTAENGKSLEHHGLAVICKARDGKTFVSLVFRPSKKTPFTGCSLTIRSKGDERILMQIDPAIGRALRVKGLPDGSRVSFHIADELVEEMEVLYHLYASKLQSHVFVIKRGELRKLSKLPQLGPSGAVLLTGQRSVFSLMLKFQQKEFDLRLICWFFSTHESEQRSVSRAGGVFTDWDGGVRGFGFYKLLAVDDSGSGSFSGAFADG